MFFFQKGGFSSISGSRSILSLAAITKRFLDFLPGSRDFLVSPWNKQPSFFTSRPISQRKFLVNFGGIEKTEKKQQKRWAKLNFRFEVRFPLIVSTPIDIVLPHTQGLSQNPNFPYGSFHFIASYLEDFFSCLLFNRRRTFFQNLKLRPFSELNPLLSWWCASENRGTTVSPKRNRPSFLLNWRKKEVAGSKMRRGKKKEKKKKKDFFLRVEGIIMKINNIFGSFEKETCFENRV